MKTVKSIKLKLKKGTTFNYEEDNIKYNLDIENGTIEMIVAKGSLTYKTHLSLVDSLFVEGVKIYENVFKKL